MKNYEDKYKPLAENLTKQGIPKEFWGVPTPEALKGEVTQDAKTQVDNYVVVLFVTVGGLGFTSGVK